MKHTEYRFSLREHGSISIILALVTPVMIMVWGSMIFYIAAAFTGEHFMPLARNIAMLPIVIAPIVCFWGIFRSIRCFRNHKDALRCLIQSILGIVLYIAIILLCEWLGGRMHV